MNTLKPPCGRLLNTRSTSISTAEQIATPGHFIEPNINSAQAGVPMPAGKQLNSLNRPEIECAYQKMCELEFRVRKPEHAVRFVVTKPDTKA